MQFLVFAAFAAVLSIPADGLPWPVTRHPLATWGAVIGQVVLAGALAVWVSRDVQARLDKAPGSMSGAQRRFGQGHFLSRVFLAIALVGTIYGTDFCDRVRGWRWLPADYGLDELFMLVPFTASAMVSWLLLYPADRALKQVSLEMRLWAAAPGRAVWSRGQYLGFMLRQHMLVIALPMIPIVIANDILQSYRGWLTRRTGLPWMQDILVGAIAGVVFLLAPLALRFIWQTRVLPEGELHRLLKRLCGRVGLTYHRILIWETDGMVVNAAVMGLIWPVRYILLSDGLLEMMEDRKIEAVFGHEAGHVKLRHIQFFLLFALVSMFAVGGIMELIMYARNAWPGWFDDIARLDDYLQVGAMGLIVVVWALGFGAVSRRFEWQADLFGAWCVTPSAAKCDRPCRYHGTAGGGDGAHGSEAARASNAAFLTALAAHQGRDAAYPDAERTPRPAESPGSGDAIGDAPADPPPLESMTGRPLCASAAELFSGALYHIAMLNGIPIEAPSWRHSSIANRMLLLREHAAGAESGMRLHRGVLVIKSILLVGTLIGIAGAGWLYWPE